MYKKSYLMSIYRMIGRGDRMKIMYIISTFIATLLVGLNNVRNVIYIMNYNNKEETKSIVEKFTPVDDYDSTILYKIVDSNYDSDKSMVGKYYAYVTYYDNNNNQVDLKINIIIVPNKNSMYYTIIDNKLTTNNIIAHTGINNYDDITILEDNFNGSTKGAYNIKYKLNFIDDYVVDIKVIVALNNVDNDPVIIYPLYNNIKDNELLSLAANSLNLNSDMIDSIKHNIDISREGIYTLSILTTKYVIYNIKFIVKEMLPKRKVTLYEKTYLYLTIFFNIDNRYKTSSFNEFNTRIKYISNIYSSGYIRS